MTLDRFAGIQREFDERFGDPPPRECAECGRPFQPEYWQSAEVCWGCNESIWGESGAPDQHL